MPGKRGAPRGNQNARTHGYYSKVLRSADRLAIEDAAGCEGMDGEIAILRWKIRQLLEKQPDNVSLQLEAVRTLSKLLKAKYDLSAEQKNTLKDAILKVLTEAAIPLGLKFLPGVPK